MKKMFMMFLSFTLIVLLTACGQKTLPPTFTEEDYGLASLSGRDELDTLLAQSNKNGFYSWFRGLFAANTMDMIEEDGAHDNNQVSERAHSETNNQVAGVDEGDIIKTDGRYIYSLSWDRLNVTEVLDDGSVTLKMSHRVDAEGGTYTDLYVTDQYLVVIGYHYEMMRFSSRGGVEVDIGIYPSYGSGMTVVDVFSLTDFEHQERIEISGYVMTSRLIDNQLYVFSMQSVYLDDNHDPRPLLKHNDQVIKPNYEEIKYDPDLPKQAYTLITRLDLFEEVSVDMDILLGVNSYSNIYMTKDEIYMASSYYEVINGHHKDRGVIVSFIIEEDGDLSYGGKGHFDGYVLNQFAMDAYDNTFRLVTTEGWGDDVVNRLYVYQRKEIEGKRVLDVIGLIDEGLGKPRETVRSVRFMQDEAFVVTFELIDPYYRIDLTDPSNPIITGELEITGFSTYQHPWGEDHMIGVGYETDLQGIINGLKIALYDITDEGPTEVGHPLVLLNDDHGWQYGEALHNHKAILVSEPNDFIGFSISRSHYIDYNFYYTSDYLIFGIDVFAETPIEILASISHFELFKDDLNYEPTWWRQNAYSVQRAVTIGDFLYAVSTKAVSVHAIDNDFAYVDSIQFDD